MDETLQTVIGLLDGFGVVKELDYGTYILLASEWINAYAQAVIRTLRSAENDLGVLPLRSIAEGKLIYQSIGRDGVPVDMKRLPPAEDRVVLGRWSGNWSSAAFACDRATSSSSRAIADATARRCWSIRLSS